MKEGMIMHYPYIPEGMQNFPLTTTAEKEGPANSVTALPVQNIAPVPVPASPLLQQPVAGQPTLVHTVEYTGPESTFGTTGIPIVTPEPPHFSVPSNPLLPQQYKEILSYDNMQYMNGFLRTQIGKECLILMNLGSSGSALTRLGYLIGVGINYLLLQEPCSETIFVCDFYSINLVQILGKRCPVNFQV